MNAATRGWRAGSSIFRTSEDLGGRNLSMTRGDMGQKEIEFHKIHHVT